MTEHKKLKEICDKIGYEIPFYIEEENKIFDKKCGSCGCTFWSLNPREIIFTQEFMNKFVKFYDNKTLLGNKRIYEQLGLTLLNGNLHNPVDYLFNLLK